LRHAEEKKTTFWAEKKKKKAATLSLLYARKEVGDVRELPLHGKRPEILRERKTKKLLSQKKRFKRASTERFGKG